VTELAAAASPHSVRPPPLLIYLQRDGGGDPSAPGSGAPPLEGGTSLRWRGLLGGQRDCELLGAGEEEQLAAAAPWQIPRASSPSMWLDGWLWARCCCGLRCCAHGPDGDLELRLPGSAEARAPCQRGGVPRALHGGGGPAPAQRLRLELGRILLRRRTRRRKRECEGREEGEGDPGFPKPDRSGLTEKPGKPAGTPDGSVCPGFLGPVRDRFPVIFRTGPDRRTGNRSNRPGSHRSGNPDPMATHIFAPGRGSDAKLLLMSSCFGNCWRLFFLVLPKLNGCQVVLLNCWSCS
jgi:hypothetical protein